MCSCISTLSSAIYSFFELKEISSTPSLPRLSRHLWVPWSFFSSWTMRSSELSPASFYRWSNLLLNFTLFFAETKLSCESLCVCLRAGHNSIGETDREKQGEYCSSAISSDSNPSQFTFLIHLLNIFVTIKTIAPKHSRKRWWLGKPSKTF